MTDGSLGATDPAGNPDVLQRAFAVFLHERGNPIQLRARNVLVHQHSLRARGRHRHGGQRVVMARNATRFLDECDVGLLQERQASLERSSSGA